MPRLLASLVLAAALPAPPATPLPPGSPGPVTGELRQRHKVTLTLDGPFARERDIRPNPFLDYRLTVRFAHESGGPVYDVPGTFAADGRAGETSAEEGAKWRATRTSTEPSPGSRRCLSRPGRPTCATGGPATRRGRTARERA